MKMWQGRFTEDTNKEVHMFNASLHFDVKLAAHDIKGSLAHCQMLMKQGIIPLETGEQIIVTLKQLLEDWEKGSLKLNPEAEDIHMAMEEELINRLGPVGKVIHTARSRNDQVALDLRLYTKEKLLLCQSYTKELMEVLIALSNEHMQNLMPGYTHLQKAQPITIAHHLMAYVAMFDRDYSRLKDCYGRTDILPLGSGALATTTFPLDREYVARLLDFNDVSMNSLDAVSDRDFVIESLHCFSVIMMHLSRLCEELILWNNDNMGYIHFKDAFCTGSSMMPQKKNPDIPELIRGKTGRVYGSLTGLLTLMKGLPLAYNKDMQEDKEQFFDAVETTLTCLHMMKLLLAHTDFDTEAMKKATQTGYLTATDIADYLVKKGLPFRDAHEIVGNLVLTATKEKKELHQLSYDTYKNISSLFEQDILSFTPEKCVEGRTIQGGPSPKAIEESMAYYQRRIEMNAI